MRKEDKNLEFKYLDISKNDMNFGLWVTTVGYQSIDSSMNYPLLDHPSEYYFNTKKGRVLHEYQFVYINKGYGRFTSEHYDDVKIRQGQLLMIFPEKWHSYHPEQKTGWDEYYIGFQGPIMDMLLSRVPLVHENQVLEIGLNGELVALFRRALDAAKKNQVLSQQYLVGIVMHMLGLILTTTNNDFEDDELDQKIEFAKSQMIRNVNSEIDVIQLANELNVSYSYFRKIFKKYTGVSPNQYFLDLKIGKAKELLSTSSESIKEISFSLGYNSPEYFTNLFKKKVGMTPNEYRLLARS